MNARDGRRAFSQRRRHFPSISWRWTAVFVMVVFVVVFGVRSIFFPATHQGQISEGVFKKHPILLTDEWFTAQHQAIQSKDAQIKEGRNRLLQFEENAGPRDTWDFQDRLEWRPLHSAIGNLESERESMVADYNGRAHLVKRDPFKPDTPPTHLARITTE